MLKRREDACDYPVILRLPRLLSGRRSALQALATQLCVSLELSGQADAPFELWQTECLYGTVFALRASLVRKQQARRKNRGPFESCPPLRKLVSEKNGPEVHSKFLHHRAHRPWQVHACRPPPRNDRRADAARNARTIPRLQGPLAQPRHHHPATTHPPPLPT